MNYAKKVEQIKKQFYSKYRNVGRFMFEHIEFNTKSFMKRILLLSIEKFKCKKTKKKTYKCHGNFRIPCYSNLDTSYKAGIIASHVANERPSVTMACAVRKPGLVFITLTNFGRRNVFDGLRTKSVVITFWVMIM